jgi:hypothetical protein
MDTTDPTDSQVNPVIADQQPARLPNFCPNLRINARAKHHRETTVLRDPKAPKDHPVMEVHQALMENRAIKDHVDHPDHLAQPEDPEIKEHQVNPVNSQAKKLAHPAHRVLTANPVVPALLAKVAKLAKIAPLVPEVNQANQALQAALARLALPAVPANQAKLVHPALAIIVHQLVWLPAIKHQLATYQTNRIISQIGIKLLKTAAPNSIFIFFLLFSINGAYV